jgi:HlyD family secretion protein
MSVACRAVVLGVAAAAAATLAGGCRRSEDTSQILASGHVEATDVRISAKVPGRLQVVSVREGDAVAPGQELARTETTDLQLALRQARAEREQAGAELKLRLAGARKEDIAELEAQIRSVEADLGGAQKDLERMQGLLDSGSGTAKSRDDARTRRDSLLARLQSMRQALLRLNAGFRPEEIEAARARVAAVEAKMAQLEQQIKDATVTAPLAATVTEKVAESGELVQAGAPLVVLTNLKEPWLTVYVGALDLPKLRLGQQADVTTDDGQVRKGTITFIASQAEFTPKNVQTRDERVKLVYKVKLGLPNDDGLFKPGMPASARFVAGAQP